MAVLCKKKENGKRNTEGGRWALERDPRKPGVHTHTQYTDPQDDTT